MKTPSLLILSVLLLLAACKKKTIVEKSEKDIFKFRYVKDELKKAEHYTRKKQLLSVTFYSKENCPDSIFFYDSLGKLADSRHFSSCKDEKPFKVCTYWSNKHYKTVYEVNPYQAPGKTASVTTWYSEKGAVLKRDTVKMSKE